MRSVVAALAAVAACAFQEYPVSSIVTQDPLPECDVVIRCNGDFCADTCAPGSVVVDPWFDAAFRFQLGLQNDRPLVAMQHIGTHNSFISRANGIGLTEDFGSALFTRTLPSNETTLRVADQRYGVIDLLNMGVRHIEADIWINFEGPVVICHSPVMDPLYAVQLQESADAVGFGTVTMDPLVELCTNITFVSAMTDILNWLNEPRNAEEVVIIFLDNRVPYYTIDSVVNDLRAAFGSALLTPPELQALFGGVWPSRKQLVSMGKRIVVESNSYNPNNYTGTNLTQVAFYPTLFSEFQVDPDDITPFPNCTLIEAPNGGWYGRNWVRVLEGEVVWAPDGYDERQSGGIMFKPNGIADMLACGVGNLGISEFGPHVLPGLVWSWAEGEPNVAKALAKGHAAGTLAAGASNCTAASMSTVRGRWSAAACGTAMPALCRSGNSTVPSGDNDAGWALTAPVPFTGAGAACAAMGAGWSFDLPRDGRENALAASKAIFGKLWQQQTPGVWLNAQTS